ncbi:hypothetical protein B7463_g2214, partial [Scytalidium lignicola]
MASDELDSSSPGPTEIWNIILRSGAAQDINFSDRYHSWNRPSSIQDLLLGQPRPWMSWGYKAAYPKLATFLEKASLENKLRSQVSLKDVETGNSLYLHRDFRYNEAHAPLSVLFDTLKTIPTEKEEAKIIVEKMKEKIHIARFARILYISDISPLVLHCIFGTSAGQDIGYIAGFVDRHLNGINWAKVNLNQIKHMSDVVFMEDRSDLMSDDPQFSLSKTYFWALQTYKLFERTLDQTISTWESFKEESLPKARDGRISDEDWEYGITGIEHAIDQLKTKLIRVRRGIQDVKDLREGLQFTAAVFDSRTAVRQGDNIRLLTYITLLFLPLSFGTSIFGMQIIESGSKATRAFAITLPCITVVSTLLIFNINTIMTVFNLLVEKITFSMQREMRLHYRKDWRDRAQALHEDHLTTEPPARRATKQTSRWVYVLYSMEALFVVSPVSELNAAAHGYWIINFEDKTSQNDDDSVLSDIDGGENHNKKRRDVQRRVKLAAEQAHKEEWKRQQDESSFFRALLNRLPRESLTVARILAKVVISFLRVLLLPIWTILLVIEYVLVLITIELVNISFSKEELSSQRSTSRVSSSVRAWQILGIDNITFPRRRNNHSSRGQSDELVTGIAVDQGSQAKK